VRIRPVGAELFNSDGVTDRYDQANSRSSQILQKRQIKCTAGGLVLGVSGWDDMLNGFKQALKNIWLKLFEFWIKVLDNGIFFTSQMTLGVCTT
jgi:hypothetical protein